VGIKFGDVAVSQIIENEFRVGVLERVLDWQNQNTGHPVPKEELQKIREEVVRELNRKYPNSGIEWRKNE